MQRLSTDSAEEFQKRKHTDKDKDYSNESLFITSIGILKNCIPITLMYLIQLSNDTVSLYFFHDKSNLNIGALGLGDSLIWITFKGFFISWNILVLSRMAQAFGANNPDLLGLYLHRGMITDLTLAVFMSIFICLSQEILIFAGVEDLLAERVCYYMTWTLPGLILGILTNLFSLYLFALNIYLVPSIIQTTGAVIHIFSSYFLIEVGGLDLKGAGIAFGIMNLSNVILLLAYILYNNPYPESFFWFKKASFELLWDIFKDQCATGMMCMNDLLFISILYFMSAWISSEAVAARAPMLIFGAIGYANCSAILDVGLSQIGNALGEGNWKQAKLVLYGTLVVNSIGTIVFDLIVLIFLDDIVRALCSEPETIEIASNLMKILIFFWPLDTYQLVLGCGLRGIGYGKIGTLISFVGYFLIGLPAAYYLGFKTDLGVYGLSYAHIVALVFIIISYIWVFNGVNWEKIMIDTREKIEKDDNLSQPKNIVTKEDNGDEERESLNKFE